MLNRANVHGFGIQETLGKYFDDPSWPRLSARAFAVWTALLSRNIAFINISGGSYRELARMTGMARDTVGRGMAELIELGYIETLDTGVNRNVPRAYHMARIADPPEEKGRDFQREKMMGLAISRTMMQLGREEAKERGQANLRAAGFTDEMLAPVEFPAGLQSSPLRNP